MGKIAEQIKIIMELNRSLWQPDWLKFKHDTALAIEKFILDRKPKNNQPHNLNVEMQLALNEWQSNLEKEDI